MKKIIFRKFLNDCLIFFFITTISLSLIIWVFQAVNYFDIILEDGRSYWIYTKFTFLSLPKIISKILPFALFLGFLNVIVKYENNNQLMIFWNFGVNKMQVINFFFKASFFIVFIQILITSIIVPKSQEIARSLLRNSDINFFESFVKPKKFNDTVRNLTIYSDIKDKTGNLKNIYIKKINGENSFQITYAKTGFFENNENNEIIVLENGETINVNDDKITIFKFSKSNFILNNLDPGTIKSTKTQENSTLDLVKCIKTFSNDQNKKAAQKLFNNCNQKNLQEIFRELYKRLVIPFYTPVLILISLIIIIQNKESSNYIKYKLLTFFIGFILIVISESILRYSKDTILDNIKIIIIPFVLTFLLYFFYYFKFNLNTNK